MTAVATLLSAAPSVEADLFAYLGAIKVRARATPPAPLAAQENNAAAEDAEAARTRARKTWVKRRLTGA